MHYLIMQKSVLHDIGSAMLEVTKCIFMGLEALFPSQLEPLDFHKPEFLRKILS